MADIKDLFLLTVLLVCFVCVISQLQPVLHLYYNICRSQYHGRCKSRCGRAEYNLGPAACASGLKGICCTQKLHCTWYGGVCRYKCESSLSEADYNRNVFCMNPKKKCCIRITSATSTTPATSTLTSPLLISTTSTKSATTTVPKTSTTTTVPTTPSSTATTTASSSTLNCGKTDIVFLLDESSSVQEANFDISKNFVKNISTSFTIGPSHTQVSLVTFSSAPHSHFNLSQYTTSGDVVTAIHAVNYGSGLTNTAAALMFMVNKSFSSDAGARDNATKIGIVITDGQSNDISDTAHEAQAARDAGVVVFAVGIGGNINLSELNEMATDPDSDHVFSTTSFDNLQNIQHAVASAMCNASLSRAP